MRKDLARLAPRHKGRIYRAGTFWRYSCHDCDYGAGASVDGLAMRYVYPWLIKTANDHTDPTHWSRRNR